LSVVVGDMLYLSSVVFTVPTSTSISCLPFISHIWQVLTSQISPKKFIPTAVEVSFLRHSAQIP
jgi:hypothetical protein